MKRFLDGLYAEWKCMSTADKIKTVLGICVKIGAATIVGDIAGKSSAGRNVGYKACIALASFGIGEAVGEAAQKPIDEIVDEADKLIQARKEAKGATANA